jgi:hypothetical protein
MNYKHISFLYSITYIKNYLSNFVDILFDQESQLGPKNEGSIIMMAHISIFIIHSSL